MRLPPAAGEEALVGGIGLEEAPRKSRRPRRTAADARADRGGDPVAPRAELLHRRDRRVGTPASAPRQPAWAAPTTPASASASSTGAQSAVRMPSSRSGRSVTIASACGRSSCGHGCSTVTTSAEWTWCTVASSAPGSTAAIARRAILGDRVAVVAAAVADVEARQLAGRHAAAPPEEAVRHAGQGRPRRMTSTLTCRTPPARASRGEWIAIDLEQLPHLLGAIRRSRSAAISSAALGVRLGERGGAGVDAEPLEPFALLTSRGTVAPADGAPPWRALRNRHGRSDPARPGRRARSA